MTFDIRQVQPIQWALLAAVVLSGALLLVATGEHGIGYYSDSFGYLSGAESLRVEGPLTKDYALVHYPPLWSVVLLMLGTNTTLILLLNTVLLMANLSLLAYLMRMADVDDYLIVGSVLAVGTFPIIVLLYGTILSEALFLVMLQLSLILLTRNRLRWALMVVALAPLQRYVGVTLIAAGVLMVWSLRGYRHAMVFGIVSVLPVGFWMVRNDLVWGNPGRYVWGYQPISLEIILNGLESLAPWLLPIFAIAGGLVIFSKQVPSPPAIIRSCLWFIVIYLAFLFVSISIYDHSTPLDFRILSPVILFGWVVAAWLLTEQFRLIPSLLLKRLAALAVVLLVVAYVSVGTAYAVLDLRPKGLGLVRAIRPIHEEVLSRIPEETIVYANQVSVIRMLGRQALSLPFTFDFSSEAAIAAFDGQMNNVFNRVYAGEAVILWYKEFERTNIVSLDELQAFLPYQEYEGLIVFAAGPLEGILTP